MNIGKFNREKYNLIFYHVQTIQKTDIHEICYACSGIINGFAGVSHGIKHNKSIEEDVDLIKKSIQRLNIACKTSYSLEDFVD